MDRYVSLFTRLWRVAYGALGSLYYQGATGIEEEIPIGPEGDVLTVVSGVPAWAAAGTGGGRWAIMVNGDPDDPQPVYILDENGVPDFLEFFITD